MGEDSSERSKTIAEELESGQPSQPPLCLISRMVIDIVKDLGSGLKGPDIGF